MRARGYHKPQSRSLKMNQADQPRKVPRGIHWVGLALSLCCPTKLQLQRSTDSAFEHPHSAAFSPNALPAREAPEVSPQSPWRLNLWAPLARMLQNGRKGISFSHQLLEIVKVHFILTLIIQAGRSLPPRPSASP